MTDLPTLALSVRQPWAWAIIHARKPVENRGIKAVSFMAPSIPCRVAIHASKGMTIDEYESAREFMARLDVHCPAPADLLRGGIIGSVDVVDVVKDYRSDWFFGPRALVLRNARPCDFVPAVGALGFFRWTPGEWELVPPPARWMLPRPAPVQKILPIAAAPLFDGEP